MTVRPKFAALACLILTLAGTLVCALPARAEVVEEIIAQVNDHIIVLSEYKHSLEQLRQDLSQQSSGLDLQGRYQERSKDVLRDLIDQQLLVQKAGDLAINVDADVVKRLDEIRRQMNLSSMEALEDAAKTQGMVFEDYKENLKNNLLTQAVISREVGSRIKISPEEIKAYYDKHHDELKQSEGIHIQEILISAEGKPEADVPALRKKAEEALTKARSGGDFGDVARQYSDDPTAAKGGDVGFFERGSMTPEIETAAYALKKNQISDIITTKYGFLILKVLEKTSAGIPTLTEAEDKIQQQLYYEKIQPALREYLTQLREDSFISIKPGYTDTGAGSKKTAAK